MNLTEIKTQQTKLQAAIDDPNFIEVICAHTASGGSLLDLCETMQINYGQVMGWIRKNRVFEERYCSALDDRQEWVKETVLRELRRMSTFDIRELYNEEGSMKAVHEWPDDIAAAVESLDVTEDFETVDGKKECVGQVKKLKSYNKQKAIDMLGKTMQLFTESYDLTAKLSLEDIVGASMKKPTEEELAP